ncbi:hypothetical protein M0R45_007803 [Rubus argutus]|uniref:Uncharacterized protein n=1 Tax=Rubus argutus TaxID=59490 RepID=A0AAW1Y1B9_RUBAR
MPSFITIKPSSLPISAAKLQVCPVMPSRVLCAHSPHRCRSSPEPGRALLLPHRRRRRSRAQHRRPLLIAPPNAVPADAPAGLST